ncbi:hypothetical protein BH24ACT5_BH24ACT5_22360 [soil metagenome]
MTDGEREARIDTLTDAIAETNRDVPALTANLEGVGGGIDALMWIV